MLVLNNSLEELQLSYCNITDNGVQYVCEELIKSQRMSMLNISHNPQITSVSTSSIAKLINMATSLTQLGLYDTLLMMMISS